MDDSTQQAPEEVQDFQIEPEPRNPYWASLPVAEFLPALFERVDDYYTHLRERGWMAIWRASHKAAFAGWWTGGRLNESGDNMKIITCEANEYQNLKTHMLNMLTGTRSQPEAHAKNLDSDSQQQTAIAECLAETVRDEQKLDRKRREVNENGLLTGEGWGFQLWNTGKGDTYAVDETGKGIPAGDIECLTPHPVDVIRDVTKSSPENHVWRCIRRPVNRYDLIAEFPELADKIDGLPSYEQETGEGVRPKLLAPWAVTKREHQDDVAEYIFWHEKTRAMPQGREVHALGLEVSTYDGPLRYRKLPGERWSAGDVPGTIFGYTLFFDLLSLQQGLNATTSAITTRVSNFGVPTLWGPDGCKLQLTKLGDGLATLEGGTVKPEMLDFSQLPPSLIEYAKMVRDLMSTYSGINSVARGQPEGGVTAASALALLEARAIQFAQLAQAADIEWQRETYNRILENYQDFGDAEFIVKMAGEGNRTRAEEFTKKDIAAVSGFTIEIGNPLQATTSGRMQIIEGAKQVGVQFTMEQYWQVLMTGRLDPVTKGPGAENELISAENEALSKGQEVPVIISDNHPLHLLEHCTVDSDLESRKNPRVMAASLRHKQEHMAQWEQATLTMSALLAAKKIPACPMPPPPPGMVPPSGPGGPLPPSGPPPGPPSHGSKPPPSPMANPPGSPTQVHTEHAQPAKNPTTGQPNPHPAGVA